MAPYALMLQSGDLDGWLGVADTMPIDDVLFTAEMRDQTIATIQAFLAGEI